MLENVPTIDLDKETTWIPDLLPIVPGRATGLFDRNGRELFDGDAIVDYNHMGNGEVYADIASGKVAKKGYPSTVRLAQFRGRAPQWWHVTVEDGHEWHGGLPSGELVEKVEGTCLSADHQNRQ